MSAVRGKGGTRRKELKNDDALRIILGLRRITVGRVPSSQNVDNFSSASREYGVVRSAVRCAPMAALDWRPTLSRRNGPKDRPRTVRGRNEGKLKGRLTLYLPVAWVTLARAYPASPGFGLLA
jgi:hypothetical protein